MKRRTFLNLAPLAALAPTAFRALSAEKASAEASGKTSPGERGSSSSRAKEVPRYAKDPNVDTTFAYQSVFNPALSRELNHASAFSLRIRAAF